MAQRVGKETEVFQAIRERVTVQSGGRIEIVHPELPSGVEAEVIVMLESTAPELPPLASFVGKGKGSFQSAAEIDAFLRAERDAWDQ